MIKKNKFKIIISAIIVLLPMLFGIIMWNALPSIMTTHFGADTNADGFSAKAFAVFGLPLILLALHLVCLIVTLLDRKQKEQNAKALGMVFWIMPMISLAVNGIMYSTALDMKLDLPLIIGVIFGIMFIFMGNYLPKTKQNRRLGVKISWALNNEENWNKTHRFTGKLWVVCGFVILVAAFLPFSACVIVFGSSLAAAIIAPFVYSYLVYRRHKKQGIEYTAAEKSRAEGIAAKISAVVVPLILVCIAILMFTGSINVSLGDTSLQIAATYYTDIEVDYSKIDSVTYRKNFDIGVRTIGFGSARLSLGIFENEELGAYTLYAYTGAEEYVLMTSGDRTLVIGMKNSEDTMAMYNTIIEKLERIADERAD